MHRRQEHFSIRRSLGIELGVVLIVKIILIILAACFLFNAAHRVFVDRDIAARHLFGSAAPGER